MLKRLLFLAAVTLLALPALAATCDLQMILHCQSGSCTATTVNNGTGSCSGFIYSFFIADQSTDTVQLSTPHTSIGLDSCFNSTEFGQTFPVAYAVCFGQGSLGPGQSFTSMTMISGTLGVPITAWTWIGDDEGEEGSFASATSNAQAITCIPVISAPPVAQSGSEYLVTWQNVSDPTAQFIIEESTTPDFASVTSSQVNAHFKAFRHDVTTSTSYYYRVKATNCGGAPTEYTRPVRTVVQAPPPAGTKNSEVTIPFGSTTPANLQVFVPGSAPGSTFQATVDKAYMTVTPSSGPLPTQGITLTVTANPSDLPPGANMGTVIVTVTTPSSSNVSSHGTTTVNIPISVSLVTPVSPVTKSLPPASALVVPVVTHVVGSGNTPFVSDVRLTNAESVPIDYQVTMTPNRGTDSTLSSKATVITVEPQQTIALNDIAKNFFGFGAVQGDQGAGSLEIRALNTSSTRTYASSRTYARTANGTFGQFIAAIPFAKFATKLLGQAVPGGPAPEVASTSLSLQHIAQSSKFRTNIGLAEGAGQPASGKIKVFDAVGNLLKDYAFSLDAGEQRQINMGVELGISNLESGRLLVEMESQTGAVTAYASVLDNVTSDPLAVAPVDVRKVSASRFIIPGMAELPPPANQNFHSDLRLLNGGTSDTTINMTFYPQGGGAPVSAAPRPIRSGEMLVLDNVLPSFFDAGIRTGGSIVVTTPANASLVATGRTYTNAASGGTFGQFIPGVTPDEGVGRGERALQVLQLEESAQFRSNIGLAELTGNPAKVRVSMHIPDSKVTASTEVDLGANEFRQFRPLLSLGGPVYNARVTGEVVEGSGRVTAYGSVIDNESLDPTYVPAQK